MVMCYHSLMTAPLFRPFKKLVTARFIARPNRFLVRCDLDGEEIAAFLPNPGRLRELLLPGSLLHLHRGITEAGRKTEYTVVGVDRDATPVMLHTHITNDVVSHLLANDLLPGLKAKVVKRESKVGRSRFDFLVRDGRGDLLVEVKSCTLFGESLAMFPDAVTERGARHLRELAELASRGHRSAVVFVVHWPRATTFMPDYHTDLHFARTLLQARDRVTIIPVAVEWRQGLALSSNVRLLDIPWDYVEKEARDAGSYILVLELKEGDRLPVGRGDETYFRRGFYLYVGSAMANLTPRMERHIRLRKRFHWHVDWLRARTLVRAVIPIRSSTRLECKIADALSHLCDWSVPGFGCSDCSCKTHLFGMALDPMNLASFHHLLQYFRMDRYTGGHTTGLIV